MWEFLERWREVVRLEAIAPGDRVAITASVRDAFLEAGAAITDVHFFSGVQTVFGFEVAASRLQTLADALVRAGLTLDVTSRAAVARAAAAEGEIAGTLAVVFARGDPNLKHDVPAVPG